VGRSRPYLVTQIRRFVPQCRRNGNGSTHRLPTSEPAVNANQTSPVEPLDEQVQKHSTPVEQPPIPSSDLPGPLAPRQSQDSAPAPAHAPPSPSKTHPPPAPTTAHATPNRRSRGTQLASSLPPRPRKISLAKTELRPRGRPPDPPRPTEGPPANLNDPQSFPPNENHSQPGTPTPTCPRPPVNHHATPPTTPPARTDELPHPLARSPTCR